MKAGVPDNGARGDMAAAGDGGQIAGDIADRDVTSAFTFEPRRAPDISHEDVAAHGGNGDPSANIVCLDIAAARRYINGVVFRNVYIDGDPKTSAAFVCGGHTLKEDAIGGLSSADMKVSDEFLCASLVRVRLEMYGVIDLSAIPSVNDDASKAGNEA